MKKAGKHEHFAGACVLKEISLGGIRPTYTQNALQHINVRVGFYVQRYGYAYRERSGQATSFAA